MWAAKAGGPAHGLSGEEGWIGAGPLCPSGWLPDFTESTFPFPLCTDIVGAFVGRPEVDVRGACPALSLNTDFS